MGTRHSETSEALLHESIRQAFGVSKKVEAGKALGVRGSMWLWTPMHLLVVCSHAPAFLSAWLRRAMSYFSKNALPTPPPAMVSEPSSSLNDPHVGDEAKVGDGPEPDVGHDVGPEPDPDPGPEPHNLCSRLKRRLLFSFLPQSQVALAHLNAPITSDETKLTYLVVHQQGWCMLDAQQGEYLEVSRMATIGLGHVRIRQVHVLPRSDAIEGWVRAMHGDMSVRDTTGKRFLNTALRVRAALQTTDAGVDAVEVGVLREDHEHNFAFLSSSMGDQGRAFNTLPSAHIRFLSKLLLHTTRFAYGAKVITVAELFERMLNHTTFLSKGSLNPSLTLTPERFRELLRYLCLTVDASDGCIGHLQWRREGRTGRRDRRARDSRGSSMDADTCHDANLRPDAWPKPRMVLRMVMSNDECFHAALHRNNPSDIFCPFLKGAYIERLEPTTVNILPCKRAELHVPGGNSDPLTCHALDSESESDTDSNLDSHTDVASDTDSDTEMNTDTDTDWSTE